MNLSQGKCKAHRRVLGCYISKGGSSQDLSFYTQSNMGTKNISISDEAYSRLAARKMPKESFTDVINRLTQKRSILELAGVLTETESKDLHSEISKIRKRSTKRIERLPKSMTLQG